MHHTMARTSRRGHTPGAGFGGGLFLRDDPDGRAGLDVHGLGACLADFNAAHPDRPIGRVLGLRAFTPFDPPWADQIYAHHRLDHPDYARLEVGATGDQLPLER
ncbi:hypothetical protein [Streptomyces griseocarneus]|uniref:hypothetical protein n=1 Tax=Streptomyces griseocarneus TaxID=51201 RepID=UPI0019BF6902|nr:hypothetical protein [Streptomyces griseocarneus]MBZ6474740.1 hypothetical protein [Streptomyces griseocarneus]GHG47859.1 hypothetical protein GCM10018779_05580 [Streptomyces griseocarneus]